MKLHQRHLLALFICFVLYGLAAAYLFVKNGSSEEPVMVSLRWVVAALPFYALVSLGCYLLARLGYDVLSFRDYPEERVRLEKDIAEAKADLEKRGFKLS